MITPGGDAPHNGKLLKTYLITQGFTIKEFSSKLGVSEQMLYKYFKQPYLFTKNIKLIKKLKELGISVNRILQPEAESRLRDMLKEREEVIKRLESLLQLKEEELRIREKELQLYKHKG